MLTQLATKPDAPAQAPEERDPTPPTRNRTRKAAPRFFGSNAPVQAFNMVPCLAHNFVLRADRVRGPSLQARRLASLRTGHRRSDELQANMAGTCGSPDLKDVRSTAHQASWAVAACVC